MPRVAGVDIPDRKPIRIALRYIFGVGPTRADEICDKLNIDKQTHANKLDEDQLAAIAGYLENNFIVEGALRRQVSQNIARLREVRCYRGDRHRKGLPVHGQRTRTNARTRKGRKKTVAGKKSVKAMK